MVHGGSYYFSFRHLFVSWLWTKGGSGEHVDYPGVSKRVLQTLIAHSLRWTTIFPHSLFKFAFFLLIIFQIRKTFRHCYSYRSLLLTTTYLVLLVKRKFWVKGAYTFPLVKEIVLSVAEKDQLWRRYHVKHKTFIVVERKCDFFLNDWWPTDWVNIRRIVW